MIKSWNYEEKCYVVTWINCTTDLVKKKIVYLFLSKSNKIFM